MDARIQSTSRRLWADELRATIALAWPLILSNLTLALIQARGRLALGGSAVIQNSPWSR